MDTLASAIRGRDFEPSKRGYNKRAVDEFLEDLADNVARLEESLRQETLRSVALQRRLETAGEAVDSVEAAYIAAADAKQRLLDEAVKRAEEIVLSAEMQSERILTEPRIEAKRTRKEAGDILLQAKARLESAENEARQLATTSAGRIDEARADADRIRDSAVREADAITSGAVADAEATLSGARTEVLAMVAASQTEAEELISATRAEHDAIVQSLRTLKAAVDDMLKRGAKGSEAIRVVLDEEAELAVETLQASQKAAI